MAKKLLNGKELAGFIKQRQAKQVRMLRQAHKIIPKLVIIQGEKASDVISTYVRMKQRYASDILIETEVVSMPQTELPAYIDKANRDSTVHGIVLQLPLDEPSQTESIVNLIAPEKDVDGLGERAHFISATAEAIDWLLSGYGVELAGKKISLLGRGKLVGRPLEKLWKARGYNLKVLDRSSTDIDATLADSQVIVSATGVARILNNQNVPHGITVVDAGTVSEDGKIVGDAADELQVRRDLTITPPKGGVGPLTIVLMFDHVIQAALSQISDN